MQRVVYESKHPPSSLSCCLSSQNIFKWPQFLISASISLVHYYFLFNLGYFHLEVDSSTKADLLGNVGIGNAKIMIGPLAEFHTIQRKECGSKMSNKVLWNKWRKILFYLELGKEQKCSPLSVAFWVPIPNKCLPRMVVCKEKKWF